MKYKTFKIIHLKTLVWLYALIIMCMFSSCEKDPLEACRKDPTCEYFVCKVDEERWEPQCNSQPLFGCSPWDVQYYRKTSGIIEMHVKNEKIGQNFIFLNRNDRLKIGENKLYKDEFISTFFGDRNNLPECKIYIIDTLISYSFNVIKIDTFNYFLSGTFYFTGKNDCGDEVKITEGEFNLPYRF